MWVGGKKQEDLLQRLQGMMMAGCAGGRSAVFCSDLSEGPHAKRRGPRRKRFHTGAGSPSRSFLNLKNEPMFTGVNRAVPGRERDRRRSAAGSGVRIHDVKDRPAA